MASFSKILDLFGFESAQEEEFEDIYDNIEEEEDEIVEQKSLFGKKSKLVPMQIAQDKTVVISQPKTFEQADEICKALKEKRLVIFNLEYINKEDAKSIVDFVSGGIYALDGTIQKVSSHIFLAAPASYEVANQMTRDELKNKISPSWLKAAGMGN